MNFTVYRSSAGSGKTFTLVKEYLRLALDDVSDPPVKFRRILAITFTNKAAQEMKERVIAALRSLSGKPDEKSETLRRILVESLNISETELQLRSQRLLRTILHRYAEFSIGTIDSFTQKITRSFTHDLDLPANYQIETESNQFIRKAVDQLISLAGKENDLTTLLTRFSQEKADDEKSWQVEEELYRTASNLLEENGTLMAQELRNLTLEDFTEIAAQLHKITTAYETEICSIAEKAVAYLESTGVSPKEFYQGDKGIGNWFYKILNSDLKDISEANSYVRQCLETDTYTSKTFKDKSRKELVESAGRKLGEYAREIISVIENHYPEYITRTLTLDNIYSLAVLNEIEKIIVSYRNEDNVIHISEFNRIIAKVISEAPVPYIFEKLGTRYSHFLIDEFQDTSRLQWHNLLPLIENGLAEGNFSMLVGDAKQAIYRWRGGDASQFVRLPQVADLFNDEFLPEREAALKRNYKAESLGTNYRSSRNIVEFNNRLYNDLKNVLYTEHQQVYTEAEQKFKSAETDGYAELRFPERSENKNERSESYVNESLQVVQSLITDGWEQKDIAILVRFNYEGSAIATQLLNHGYSVLSSDSLLLKNSDIVRCIVSILRCLEFPEDRVALADTVTLLNKIKHSAIPVHVLRDKEFDIHGVLKLAGFSDDFHSIAFQPMYQQCEFIIRAVFSDERRNAWVIFFLDELLRFAGSRNPDRSVFFEWWKDRSRNASLIIPEGTNAIRIMTIHKAKGLEFPVVIVPFVTWRPHTNNVQQWVRLNDKDVPQLPVALVAHSKITAASSVHEQYKTEVNESRLERLNLLYVATTRAIHQLYVLSEKPGGKTENPESAETWLYNCFRNELNEDNTCNYGTKRVVPGSDEHEAALMKLDANSGVWQPRLRIRKYSEEAWSNSQEKSPRESGILLHALLQKVRNSEDVDNVIATAIASGQISSNESDYIRNVINGVVKHPELEVFYNSGMKSLTERDIIIPGSGMSRPDCVILDTDKATVIEYKSGAESDEHVDQVKHYINALTQMGYNHVQGKLVYLSPLKIINI